MTEGRATGIPKILRVMRANGSPVPRFETDEHRTSFLIRLPVHPKAETPTAQVTAQVTPQVTAQVGQFLGVCRGAMNRDDLQQELGLAPRENFRRRYLVPALDGGLIKMTISANPNSRLQKYRLTAQGRAGLAQHTSTPPQS